MFSVDVEENVCVCATAAKSDESITKRSGSCRAGETAIAYTLGIVMGLPGVGQFVCPRLGCHRSPEKENDMQRVLHQESTHDNPRQGALHQQSQYDQTGQCCDSMNNTRWDRSK